MLEHIQDTLTVDSIMTERGQLLTLKRSEDPSTIQENVRELEINQVPVVNDDSVVGIMIADPEDRTLPEREHQETIAPKWLVSADTSIRKLIDILDNEQHPARFVFQENRVIGLVTYADLNDAVARTALYLLISRLEIQLARFLRQHERDSWAYVQHLSSSRQGKFDSLREEMSRKDVTHDPIEHFNLVDVFRSIRNEDGLRGEIGFQSKSQFDKATSGINEMRKSIAHSVRLVVDGVDGVASVNHRCGRIEELLERIPSHPPQNVP